jgi:hypothetical protein
MQTALPDREPSRRSSRAASVLRVVVPLAIVAAYVVAAMVHARIVNTDAHRHDQSTYLWAARELKLSGYAAPTNRMQMPAYLYVQAFFLDPAADEASMFARGKDVNIALSVLLLGALAIFFRRTLPRTEAAILTLITAFTVFVFRAGYVQAELLFYTTSFLAFVALCRLWVRPSPSAALVAGLLEAAAFLTKGSVPPGLALFVAMFLARELREACRAPPLPRHAAHNLRALAVLPVAFLAPLVPYLRTSKALYGSYFFNLSSTYVVWMDSWDDFLAKDRPGLSWHTWALLPPGEAPSLGRYLREHSIADVLRREGVGLGEVLGNVLIGHGYAEYIAVYLAFALLAVSAHRAPLAALRRMSLRSETTFTAAYALLYTLLFGFYAPIAAGNRFILMLFLPVLYTLMHTAPRRPGTVSAFGRTLTRDDLNAFVLASIVLWILFGLPSTITRVYAGG